MAGIVGKAFEKMVSLGAKAKHTSAYIAPCIHECCFEVGEEVAEQFPDIAVNRTGYAKPHVNLPVCRIATDSHGHSGRNDPSGLHSLQSRPLLLRTRPRHRSGRNFTFAKL